MTQRAALRARLILVPVLAMTMAPVPMRAQRGTTAPATTQFDVDLFRAVASTSAGRNVFISPVSAHVAVAMAYEGATGATRTAIAHTLGQRDDAASLAPDLAERLRALTSDHETTVSIASSLWARADAPLEPAYLGRVRSAFGAEVAALDLTSPAAVARINGWVSRATRGRIPAMVSEPLPDEAVAVLMNAVYFKGSWKDAFEPDRTTPRPFHTGGRTIEHPAMTRVGSHAYARRKGFQVLRLPYRGERFSMYVLLPDATTPLDSLTGALAPARSAEWMAALGSREVQLQLPKFKLENAVDLAGPLTSLGMGVAFDSQRASFARMLPASYLARRNVFITRAAQKTFVAVDEEGTEAAAATMMEVGDTAAPPPPVRFIVDRPFLFLIREESKGTVLFIGRITDPR